MIIEPAPAKINLALHIRAKRPDGYHDLETLFAFAGHGDVVTVALAAENRFEVVGPFAVALGHPCLFGAGAPPSLSHGEREEPSQLTRGEGDWQDNLVTRAAHGFGAAFTITRPHTITLDKRLPIASGIGGGSADAAATLRALAQLHGLDPQDDRLFAVAAQLGADVPACLLGCPALGTGKGDRLDPLARFGDLPLLLVNPRVPLATAPMFAAWDGVDCGPIASEGSVLERAGQGRNDFTAPAIAAAPVIADVLALLAHTPGASLTRMSGSGATCFALFENQETRDLAGASAEQRGWWTLATTLV